LGQKTVGVDVNFTRFVIEELQDPAKRKRLLPALSLFEKIKMNELMQKATFDDRYDILPGEQKSSEITLANGLLLERPDIMFHIVERKVKVGDQRSGFRISVIRG